MSEPFLSYAQNGEDVVLWRALGHVEGGRYVDVGANDPEVDSVTKVFYDRGWSGLNVEPADEYATRLLERRPRDQVAQVAVTDVDHGTIDLHVVPGTGLSTIEASSAEVAAARGFDTETVPVPTRRLDSLVAEYLDGVDVHFCKIDVEGAESLVLGSVDLSSWRPWVLVVEATAPQSTTPTHHEWEPGVLDAGYRLCLFDGLSRFYVADERAADLEALLSYPACVLDDYIPVAVQRTRNELHRLQSEHHVLLGRHAAATSEAETLRSDLREWRHRAMDAWGAAVVAQGSSTDDARPYIEHIDALTNTLSWRITRPLRAVRTRLGGSR